MRFKHTEISLTSKCLDLKMKSLYELTLIKMKQKGETYIINEGKIKKHHFRRYFTCVQE
jgi:hypothetical protein